jgi:acetylcholinesterase
MDPTVLFLIYPQICSRRATLQGCHLLQGPISTRVRGHYFLCLWFVHWFSLLSGTAFTDPLVNSTEQIRLALTSNFTSSLTGTFFLEKAIDKILALYPDDPALGSPFNTGDETFGLSSQFKRASAICECTKFVNIIWYLNTWSKVGDVAFQSQRRSWIQVSSKVGVKTYGYLFTDPQPSLKPYLGGQFPLSTYKHNP